MNIPKLIADALIIEIRGLSIPGVRRSDVHFSTFPVEMHPEIGIMVMPLQEVVSDGTNEEKDIGYRYAIVRSYGSTDTNNTYEAGIWRDIIHDQFDRVRRNFHDDITNSVIRVEYGEIKDAQQWRQANVDSGILMITVWVRKKNNNEQ